MPRKPISAKASGPPRHYGARVLDDPRHDPYQPRGKYPPTRCATCGAVYRAGRWQWAQAAASDAPGTCPACRRIADGVPAGWLTLTGAYLTEHADELLRIARNEEKAERDEHPMHRIMGVSHRGDAIELTTTDIHLPRRIGEALRRAHDGDLEFTFSDDDYRIRVSWKR